MPTLSLAGRPPGRLRVCDARHVGVRAGLYRQPTPHKDEEASAATTAKQPRQRRSDATINRRSEPSARECCRLFVKLLPIVNAAT